MAHAGAFCAAAGVARARTGAARVCARRGVRASDGGDESMDTYRRGARRRLYGGDLLPFDVRVITPPAHALGRFRLDARTHCGDVIERDGRHYVVKSVTLHYQYGRDGRPRVVRKSMQVKSLARRALELRLERALRADG